MIFGDFAVLEIFWLIFFFLTGNF